MRLGVAMKVSTEQKQNISCHTHLHIIKISLVVIYYVSIYILVNLLLTTYNAIIFMENFKTIKSTNLVLALCIALRCITLHFYVSHSITLETTASSTKYKN